MLINSVVYDDGCVVVELVLDGVFEVLVQQFGFVWIVLCDLIDDEFDWLQCEFGLLLLVVEDVCKGYQCFKVEEYGDMLFVVMYLFEVQFDGDLQVGEVYVFVGLCFVVLVWYNSQQGFLGVCGWVECELQLLCQGLGFVFYVLMDVVVDCYFLFIDVVEVELEQFEVIMFQFCQDCQVVVQWLFGFKQCLVMLCYVVMLLLEVMFKLYGGWVLVVCKVLQDYFCDVYDYLLCIQVSIDVVCEIIIVVIQVNFIFVIIDEFLVIKCLVVWVVIFVVFIVLVGIWGMNFDKMFELKWVWGYLMVLSVIVFVSGVLYWCFKCFGWL